MGLLIAGVLLGTGAHLFKRIAPGPRAAMGTAGKAVIAVLLLVRIWMMTKGYQAADGGVFRGRHPMTVGINNLLMLLSVYMFAASGMKTALARRMRHPSRLRRARRLPRRRPCLCLCPPCPDSPSTEP